MTTPSKRISIFSNLESHSPHELTPLHTHTSPSTTSRQHLPNRPIFSNDQEIFLDSPTPLILLSDHNVVNPFQTSVHRSMNQSRIGTSYFFRNLDISSHATNTHTVNNSPSKKLDLMEQSEVEASEVLKTPKTNQSKRDADFSEGKSGAREVSASGGVSGSEEPVDVFQINKVEGILDLSPRQAKLKAIVDSTPFTAVFSFFVFYALYADDVRQVAFNVHADPVFDVFTMIVLVAFTIEISLNFYVDKAYRWSLFFFLDVISTLSFILNLNFVSSSAFPSGTTNAAQIARASRASRVGTRAGRLVRVIRMFRVLKIFGNVNLKDKKKKNRVYPTSSINSMSQSSDRGLVGIPIPNLTARGSRLSRLSIRSEEDFSLQKKGVLPGTPGVQAQQVNTQQSLGTQMQLARKGTLREEDFQRQDSGISSLDSTNGELKESRVGKKLSDLTTKRVVVIVLLMLTLIPMFQSDFYFDDNASADYEVQLLAKLIDSSTFNSTTVTTAETYFKEMEVAHNPQLLLFKIGDTTIFDNPSVDRNDLRDDEMNSYEISTNQGTLFCITNGKPDNVLDSALSLGRTTWTIIILVVGALLFSKDANVLLLRPIERMIKKVNRIAQNPLIAKEERLVRDDYNDGFENETIEIENAIIKIGGLLALGYGDAGSTIIAQNMAQSGDLNPMLAGRKIAAIFGFCDIRNFTDATEVLQAEVMVFVNSIADIVHSIVDRYGGTANKNIGDAFLLAWKLPEEDVLEEEDGTLEVRNSQLVNNLADFALISFVKIQAKINRDPTLLAYRDDPRLNSRLPNYKVKMGFGLHLGWAIEGAIGSEFKIDASYLSPNVNLASRLEAATKQYGVPLLFSGDLTRKMSPKMQERARLIDIVTLKGSLQPLALYTCDMDVNDLIIARNREKVPKIIRREKQKRAKETLHELLFEGDASRVLDDDKELQHLFRNNDPVFNNIFSTGFEAYVNGDWSIAKKKFEECLAVRPEDGPTKSLMRFLKENDFIAPEGWEGYRALTEK